MANGAATTLLIPEIDDRASRALLVSRHRYSVLVDPDLISCICGMLPDEHRGGLGGCRETDCPCYEPDPEHVAYLESQEIELVKTRRFSIEEAAERIGLAPELWAGECYGVACDFTEKELVEGVAVYGHYLGLIHEESLFSSLRHVGFCQHGWVSLPDGSVLDPTRWVFEHTKPYIYEGPADDYDEGGNKLRKTLRGACPPFAGTSTIVALDESTASFVRQLAGDEPLDDRRLAWIANTPLAELGTFAPAIYEAIRRAGYGALIPFDNERAAERMSAAAS